MGALGKAQVEMAQRRVELDLFLPIAEAIRNGHPAFKVLESAQLSDQAAKCRAKALQEMVKLNGELAGRRFMAGDAFSVADITALCAIDFMKLARLRIPDECEHLARWHREVSARPSAAA